MQRFGDLGKSFEAKYYDDNLSGFIDDISSFIEYNIDNPPPNASEDQINEHKKRFIHLKRFFTELLEVYYYDSERAIASLKRREDDIINRKIMQYPVLKGIITPLLKNPNYTDFTTPVDVKLYPTYELIIRQPICLQEIRKKLENRTYDTYGDFVNDFYRVFDNAMIFNSDDKKLSDPKRFVFIYFSCFFLLLLSLCLFIFI